MTLPNGVVVTVRPVNNYASFPTISTRGMTCPLFMRSPMTDARDQGSKMLVEFTPTWTGERAPSTP